jgi:hypothetical protein
VNEWQPIETAPRDGTGLLLWADWRSEVCFGKFQTKKRGAFALQGWTLTFKDGYKLHGEREPSHWMPLPPPPTQPQGEGQP